MSEDDSHKHQEQCHPDDVPDLLLGKRYDSAERDPEEMFRTAHILGFSRKEILELERLYQVKSNK